MVVVIIVVLVVVGVVVMIMATKKPIIDRKTFSLFPENVLHF